MNNYVKGQISGSINKFHRLNGSIVVALIMLQQWSPQHVTKEYKFMVCRETTFNNKILKIARAMETFSPGQLTPTI